MTLMGMLHTWARLPQWPYSAYIAAGGAIFLSLCWYVKRSSKRSMVKLHVDYYNLLDNMLIIKMMVSIIPERLLRTMLVKQAAPKARANDVYDVMGEDPYEIVEVQNGKVWLVTYRNGGGDPREMKGFGLGLEQDVYEKVVAAARLKGVESLEQAKRDWKTYQGYCAISQEDGRKGAWCKASQSKLIMCVVKLKSGDILLYCPVHIHEGTQLQKWLYDLGPVKYVVIGSCYHTNYIPSTTKRFPEAKVIGTTMAEMKLNAVKALPRSQLDYDFLSDPDIEKANMVLVPEGVKLKFTCLFQRFVGYVFDAFIINVRRLL